MVNKSIGVILLSLSIIIFILGLNFDMPFAFYRFLIPTTIVSMVLLFSSTTSKNAGKNHRLDEQVKAYFNTHDQLDINDAITLKKPMNEGLTFNNLIVLYNDEVIGRMIEFNQYFPEAYKILSNRTHQATLTKTEVHKAQPQQPASEPMQAQASVIDLINDYNVTITDEQLSQALYNTTARLKHLEILQTKYPKDNHKLDKLYEHYLPILLEILKNYVAVEHASKGSKEASALQQKLMKTIILINEAIQNITSSLFDEEMMNLSADMTVLENILKQDGLIQDDMDINSLNRILKQQEEAYVKEEK